MSKPLSTHHPQLPLKSVEVAFIGTLEVKTRDESRETIITKSLSLLVTMAISILKTSTYKSKEASS